MNEEVLLKYTTKERLVTSLSVDVKNIKFSENKYTGRHKDALDRTITPSIDIEKGKWNCSCEDYTVRKILCKHGISLLRSVKKEHQQAFISALEGKPQVLPVAPSGYLSSGIDSVDKLLGGGLPKGLVVGVTGEPLIGKSWLSYHFAVQVARQGGKALYLDADGNWSNVNARMDMAHYYSKRYNIEVNDIFQRIDFLYPRDVYIISELLGLGLHLKKSEKRVTPHIWDETKAVESPLYKFCKMENYQLVVLDSITNPLKKEVPLPPMQNTPSRASILNEIWGRMEMVARDFALPFIVVHHSTKDPSSHGYGSLHGGDTVLYQLRYILYILNPTKYEFEKLGFGKRGRRLWRFRTPSKDSEDKTEAMISLCLDKNFGFRE